MATIGLLNAAELTAATAGELAAATAGELAAATAGAKFREALWAGEQAREVVSSGFRTLDGLLPAGGVRRGSLVEWLCADEASGASALAFAVACRLAGEGNGRGKNGADAAASPAGTIVVVDRRGRFHPPAVMPWLEGRQLVVARPSRDDDEAWAIDQSLRCPGVAAVLAWPNRIHPTAMRRWQLAARASRAVGLFVRPDAARREPSWAEARIAVSAMPGEPGQQPAMRWLRLASAGGQFSIGGTFSIGAIGEPRAVEVVLDLARGCEGASGRVRKQPCETVSGSLATMQEPLVPRRALGAQAGLSHFSQAGGRSCRAS